LLRTAAGLDALFQAFPGLYFQLDADGVIQAYRATDQRELYVPPATFLGRRMVEVLPPEVSARFAEVIQAVRSEGAPGSLEYTLDLDGRREVFLARIVPAPDAQLIVAAQCVTGARNTEAALRAAEARYRDIVEGAVEGLFQSTVGGRYLGVNPALARIYGYCSPEEVIRCITDIERQLYVDPGRRTEFIRRLQAHDSVHQFESQVYRKDGRIIWISESARAVRNSQGQLLYYEGVVEEITRRKDAEQALLAANAQLETTLRELQETQAHVLQQERLRLVGQMASGVAHDFNNLLSVILGYAEMLQHRPLDATTHRIVGEIRQAADRAVALTRRILSVGREQPVSRRTIDVNTVIRSLHPMLRRVVRADIELTLKLQTAPAQVLADPVQIERALMNLVLNARDALPRGGQVSIVTRTVLESEDGDCSGQEAAFILLQVEDNGCGMDTETQAQVFQPFFTTKPPGEGTGLGLASVETIARQSGGKVHVESEIGCGTRIGILLPRVAPELEASPGPAQAGAGSLVYGTETVLVVEDEPRLRSLLFEVLRRSGYQVLEAANGIEAIRVAGSATGPIDLLLTDLVMPGLGGLELARRLQKQRPELQVLYMSGYPEDEGGCGAGTLGEDYLQKPFEPSTLTSRIRAALDRRPAAPAGSRRPASRPCGGGGSG
jgi:PAS domain S-box-containing protein